MREKGVKAGIVAMLVFLAFGVFGLGIALCVFGLVVGESPFSFVANQIAYGGGYSTSQLAAIVTLVMVGVPIAFGVTGTYVVIRKCSSSDRMSSDSVDHC